MSANYLIFKKAEDARDAITERQKVQITNMYVNWSKEIGKMAKTFSRASNPSAALSAMQMRQLQLQLIETANQLLSSVENGVRQSIYEVADSVVESNADWLVSLGFNRRQMNVAFSSVPDGIVQKLVTGQIYEGGWNLSQRIWTDNQSTMQSLYSIVAGGVAQNKSMYDIAKDLESYVSPSEKKNWNLRSADGRLIYPKQVDYNAQRLARTLVQHSYQQSFIEVTENNPFVKDYIWDANGSRVCPICKARDGKHFPKNELPMDHPNGMCTMVPDISETLNDDLVDWFNSPDGTYPHIDEFASSFGYKLNAIDLDNIRNVNNYANVNYANIMRESVYNSIVENMNEKGDFLYANGYKISNILKMSDEEVSNEVASFFTKQKSDLLNLSDELYGLYGDVGLNDFQKLSSIADVDLPINMNDNYLQKFYVATKNGTDLPTFTDDFDNVNGIRIYRGVKDTKNLTGQQINDLLLYDDIQFSGTGIYGNGTYFSNMKYRAEEFMGGANSATGNLVELKISEAAKMIDHDTLFDEFVKYKNINSSNIDIDAFALLKGFDVITQNIDGNEIYYNVLNRGVLIARKI